MALPPNDAPVSFEREVDENLRRDQMADFARKYGKWIVFGLILFLGAVAFSLWWQDREDKIAGKHGEEMALILRDIENNRMDDVPARLDALAAESEGAARATALMTRASVALRQGDRAKAIESYAAVAGDEDLPAPYRELATLRQTLLEYNDLDPDTVIARMQPLAQQGEPFYGTAAELTAIAMERAGRTAEAAKLFETIAQDSAVPQTLRSRAEQMASSLAAAAAVKSSAEAAPAQEEESE
ncbi:tetratricopeptide repeat protein [Sphingomicrobium lutaoense]|uniref:Ancillary SecYEG translocon subunit/Cell division coordinator CpoB TPR domain-containing protein n=1 Tax=Sphingomicrobium lutaoense TaxID=515949 RepID=A0A839Z1E3_9SPHN|nr:tetratricopeptide repeat protein [Sphingomicrobium lutaoense]MBB3764378.1 hypothetical protein [Sphingomicrobium lutaoense]